MLLLNDNHHHIAATFRSIFFFYTPIYEREQRVMPFRECFLLLFFIIIEGEGELFTKKGCKNGVKFFFNFAKFIKILKFSVLFFLFQILKPSPPLPLWHHITISSIHRQIFRNEFNLHLQKKKRRKIAWGVENFSYRFE